MIRLPKSLAGLDPKWLLIGAGGLCAMGFAVGLELIPWISRWQAPQEGLDGSFLAFPEAPTMASAPKRDRLPKLSFDDLMGLLGEEAAKPVAKKFAKAFMREPRLQKAYEEHKAASGRDGKDARSFLSSLRGFPEFRRLMSHFASEPGFRQMVGGLLQKPEIEELLSEEKTRQERAAMAARSWTASPGSARNVGRSFKESLGSMSLREKNATGTTAAKPEGSSGFTGEAAASALQQPGRPESIADGALAGGGSGPMEHIVTGTSDGGLQPPPAAQKASAVGTGAGNRPASVPSCYALLNAELCGRPSAYCDGIARRWAKDGDLLSACKEEGVLDRCEKALDKYPDCKKIIPSSAKSASECQAAARSEVEASMRQIASIHKALKEMAGAWGGVGTWPVLSGLSGYDEYKGKAEAMLNEERCKLQLTLNSSPACKSDEAVFEAHQCRATAATNADAAQAMQKSYDAMSCSELETALFESRRLLAYRGQACTRGGCDSAAAKKAFQDAEIAVNATIPNLQAAKGCRR